MEDKKIKIEKKNKVNPVAVAVTSAIVGAGVVVAGAMVLKDKNNREKIKETLSDVKDKAEDYIQDVKQQVKEKAADMEADKKASTLTKQKM